MSMQGNGFAAEVHKRGIQTGIPEGWSPAEDLLEVPGVKRSDYEEKFYAREYPLKSWLLNNPEFVRYIFEVGARYIVEQYGEALKELQVSCSATATEPPADVPHTPGEDLTDFIRS